MFMHVLYQDVLNKEISNFNGRWHSKIMLRQQLQTAITEVVVKHFMHAKINKTFFDISIGERASFLIFLERSPKGGAIMRKLNETTLFQKNTPY